MLKWLRSQDWLKRQKIVRSTYKTLMSLLGRAKAVACWPKRQKIIRSTYLIFGKTLSKAKVRAVDRGFPNFANSYDLAYAILLSNDGLARLQSSAMDLHLFLIHNARLKLVRYILPPGQIILDLGGANSPLHKMGYSHNYSKIIMIDLPTEERHKDFQVEVDDGGGKIFIRYEDMTDLKGIESNSVNLVWSGQSIEHVTLENGIRMCKEAFRVLEPGGYFCLDTPNRLITKLHTAAVGGGFIHPDHKIEYTPYELREMLVASGFIISEEWGVCEMPLTVKNKSFTYDDFVVGSAISKNINDSYIQFFACMKPKVSFS
jgi:ubiquinone/menaquinone biosynthesis C-methylase UbiE